MAIKLTPFLRRIIHVGKQMFSQKLFEGTKEKSNRDLNTKTPEWREAPNGPHICCCFFLLQSFPVHRVDQLSQTEHISQDHVTRTETRRQTQKVIDVGMAMGQDQLKIWAGKSPPDPNFYMKLLHRHWLMPKSWIAGVTHRNQAERLQVFGSLILLGEKLDFRHVKQERCW